MHPLLTSSKAILDSLNDGVLEIENQRGESLDVEGFVNLLQTMGYPDVPLHMTDLGVRLLQYSNDIRLPDDMTLLEIRFHGTRRSR